MKTFTDNAGRTWTVQVNVAAVKRVRGLVGIDLYKLVDDGFQALAKLVSDPVQLADVLVLPGEGGSGRQADHGRGIRPRLGGRRHHAGGRRLRGGAD